MPPSLNLLRRSETFGVLAFLFRQVCQNTIPRVSTRVLRKDFVLAEVFYFDLLSDFEQSFSGNCLKRREHACQSCFQCVRNYNLRAKQNFNNLLERKKLRKEKWRKKFLLETKQNSVFFSQLERKLFGFFEKKVQQGFQNCILGVPLSFLRKSFSSKQLFPHLLFRFLAKRFITFVEKQSNIVVRTSFDESRDIVWRKTIFYWRR